MGRIRKGIRTAAATIVLLLILLTVISYFLPASLPDEYKDGLPEGYLATDSARSPWLSVDADGTARVHPERCVHKKEIVIPEVINGVKVTGYYCDLETPAPWVEKITFAATIDKMSDFPVHRWTGLKEIVFKDGVTDLSSTYLGTKASLEKLVIPPQCRRSRPRGYPSRQEENRV